MRKTLFSIVTATTALLVSCGADTSNSNEEPQIISEETSTRNYGSPCELFSEADVKKKFDIGESVEFEMNDKDLTFPTCSYKWKDGKVKKRMEIGAQMVEVDMDSEVMIVMVANANESKYNTSIKSYSDAKAETTGEMSTWSDRRSQLTFLAKEHLFHVHVKASNETDENKKNAIEIANQIIAAL